MSEVRVITQFRDAANIPDGELYVCDMQAMRGEDVGHLRYEVEQALGGVKAAFPTCEAAIEYIHYLRSKAAAIARRA